ncbi:MAG: hypothetical protein JST49_06340 [Bacteroidetes bacterium]|nr:hypothetical protein [Bacteroidota bacterium]
MKKLYILLTAALFTATVAQAKTYVVNSGKWTDAAAWNGDYAGTTISEGDVVIITGSVTMNTNVVVAGTVKVEKGASMVGMKDLVVTKTGMLVNHGNTVMKTIVNEGIINNNLVLETMVNFENKGIIGNDNTIVAGNNIHLYDGKAEGNGGTYFANNTVVSNSAAVIGKDVKVLEGGILMDEQPAVAPAVTVSANK